MENPRFPSRTKYEQQWEMWSANVRNQNNKTIFQVLGILPFQHANMTAYDKKEDKTKNENNEQPEEVQ